MQYLPLWIMDALERPYSYPVPLRSLAQALLNYIWNISIDGGESPRKSSVIGIRVSLPTLAKLSQKD